MGVTQGSRIAESEYYSKIEKKVQRETGALQGNFAPLRSADHNFFNLKYQFDQSQLEKEGVLLLILGSTSTPFKSMFS